MPLFLFVAQCYALHVSTKAIVSLSGADYRTVKGYIESIQKALREKVKAMREEWQLKLGGPGKVVEIDEMFVCSRKYGRGRRMAKEGTWIFGLMEVDEASHPIENPDFLEKLKQMEEEREAAPVQRQEKRKRRKTAKRMKKARKRRHVSAFIGCSEPYSVETSEWIDDEIRFDDGDENGGEMANEEEDRIDIVHVGNDVQDEGSLARI